MKKLTIAEDRKTERGLSRTNEDYGWEGIDRVPDSLERLRRLFFERMKGKSFNTLKEYRRSVRELYTYMVKESLSDLDHLTPSDIQGFQRFLYQERYHSSVTVHYHLKTLSRYCNFLIQWNGVTYNPFKDVAVISKPAQPKRPRRYYSFDELERRYRHYLRDRFCYRTLRKYLYNLKRYIEFLKERGIKSIYSTTYQTILEYKDYLWHYRNPYGFCYSPTSQLDKLKDLKKFYKYLKREGLITQDPTKRLDIQALSMQMPVDDRPKILPPKVNPSTQLDHYLDEFCDYARTKGYRPDTIKEYQRDLKIFFDWLYRAKIRDAEEVTKAHIRAYYSQLHSFRGLKGQGWSGSSRYSHLISIRNFFRYLARYDHIPYDPTSMVELPKKERGLPMSCLSEEEATRLLKEVDLNRPLGLRDWAILEVLYSTGIRANELCALTIDDIDFEKGLVRIRNPKGGRSFERVVPIGKIACQATLRYLNELRPKLASNTTNILFLSENGHHLYNNTINRLVKTYAQKARIRKRITTHSWRVGCATELLRNGADLRYVQEQLGHRCIETTKLYARLVPKDLKEVHSRCHPRERYYRKVGPINGG